jgi:hypothetical protein
VACGARIALPSGNMRIQLRATLCSIAVLLACAWLCGTAFAQRPSMAALNSDSVEASPAIVSTLMPQTGYQHKFWDKKNWILFTAVAGTSAADFAITRANLRNGGQELNPVTRLFGRSTAGLALNFAGETAGSVGLSYFFHKTGHHKMERIVSFVSIGGSTAAVSFDLAHR